jgi:hypothetical protein
MMRKFLFYLSIIFCVASFVVYYTNKNSQNVSAEQKTKPTTIKVAHTLIDVGENPIHLPVTGKFTVYNVGKENLFITDVKPDCHCTAVDFPKKAILPKDSAIVYLKYDAANPGVFQSSAIMSTNSDPTATILVMRGYILMK